MMREISRTLKGGAGKGGRENRAEGEGEGGAGNRAGGERGRGEPGGEKREGGRDGLGPMGWVVGFQIFLSPAH